MNIKYNKVFINHLKKRIIVNPKLHQQFKQRFRLFNNDSNHPLLKDHQLKGKRSTFRAFSITGDIRVIYQRINDIYYFFDIGTHNQVY